MPTVFVLCCLVAANCQLANGGDTGHVELNVAEVGKDLTYVLSISFCLTASPCSSRVKHAAPSAMTSWSPQWKGEGAFLPWFSF